MIMPLPRKQPALNDVECTSPQAYDVGTSSDDQKAEDAPVLAEDARSVVGVSIGREQSRLTSPKTPALEKTEVIQKGGAFFGEVAGLRQDESQKSTDWTYKNSPSAETAKHDVSYYETNRDDLVPSTPVGSQGSIAYPLPSPWRSKPRTPERTEHTKTLFRDGLLSRQRASSESGSTLENWQKAILSLPKKLAAFPFATDKRQAETAAPQHDGIDGCNALAREGHPVSDANTRPAARQPPPSEALRLDRLRLARSISDDSLVTSRTVSYTSLLGDDSRFDHVQAQVNSRIKAIRDSWQDSSIKLPSIPSLRTDAFRERLGKQDEHRHAEPKGASQANRPVDPLTRQPYQSAKSAVSDVGGDKEISHPQLNRALSMLEGDVVVLGGYRGSILRSAQPPHKQLWVPIKVGLNIRKADLEVGIGEDDDERATEKVFPGGMLTHIGPVDISRRLIKRLRTCDNARHGKLRVHDYGYDWRLSPLLLSRQFCHFVESLPCNQAGVPAQDRGALVVAHSLGGLITRHVVNHRPDLFKGVIYAGVPTSCVNILGPLRNGDEVLLSHKVLTAQVNFTFRTSFALLPLDGRCFIDKHTREEYPVDFFDPNSWIEYRLSPCVARSLLPRKHPESKGITGYVSSVARALPSLPLLRRKSSAGHLTFADVIPESSAGEACADSYTVASSTADGKAAPLDDFMSLSTPGGEDVVPPTVSTAVSIQREKAIAYLTRTLSSVKQFKEELAFLPEHASSNRYPPISVIYGKNTPTVIGAKVDGRQGIKHADAYDELAFASGDGVVLAKAAMAPEGYSVAKGGLVSSERGHVTLLGDLEAVGKCLNAIMAARRGRVGCGK